MSQQMCPNGHGPFDGQSCPYCGYIPQRPAQPRPLSEDDQVTDPGGYRGAPRMSAGVDDGEDPTVISAQKGGRQFLDSDEEEITQIGQRAKREDVTELDIITTGTLGILWVKEGRRRGQIFKIGKGTKIGREEGDLLLDDPKVSSLHGKITLENDRFLLWDFGSSNGTYVNGKRIREATLLEENDTIKIGETIFIVKFLDSKTRKKPVASKSTPAKKSSSARSTTKAR